jgi:hypothetical protein
MRAVSLFEPSPRRRVASGGGEKQLIGGGFVPKRVAATPSQVPMVRLGL